MKKHSLTMLFLLILTLSLVGVVSACDNVTQTDDSAIEIDDLEVSHSDVLGDSVGGNCEEIISYCSGDEIEDVIIKCNDDCQFNSESDCSLKPIKINDKNVEMDLCEIGNSSFGYLNDNLLTLSDCDLDYESLTIAFDTILALNYGNTSPEIIVDHLDSLNDSNTWVDECILALSQEHISLGLESEQDAVQTFNNYPLYDLDLPPVNALGVSGDFDDDAFICKSINASGKKASFAVGVVNKSGSGLDLKSKSNQTQLASSQMEQIGVDAVTKALNYFKSQGIDISKDYSCLYVLTSADYVKLNGQSTSKVLDGILKALGSKFSKKHLISTDDLSKKDLIIYFIYTNADHSDYTSYALKYADSKFSSSVEAKNHGDALAYDRGIYHKQYSHYNRIVPAKRTISSNSTLNNTNKTESVNQTDNSSSVDNTELNSNNDTLPAGIDKEPEYNGNPFNIVYTLLSILMVCVIFGVGYRKR